MLFDISSTTPTDWLLWLGALVALAVSLLRQWRALREPNPKTSRPPNPTRKLVHIALFACIGLLALPTQYQFVIPLVWFAGFLIGWLVFPQEAFAALAWSDVRMAKRGVHDTGIIAYPTVLLWTTLLAGPATGMWLLCYLAVGDGLASLLGARGERRLPWNPAKTWRGLVAFVLGSTVVASLLLAATPSLSLSYHPMALALALAIVLGWLESLPGWLDDNLRIGAGFLALVTLLTLRSSGGLP